MAQRLRLSVKTKNAALLRDAPEVIIAKVEAARCDPLVASYGADPMDVEYVAKPENKRRRRRKLPAKKREKNEAPVDSEESALILLITGKATLSATVPMKEDFAVRGIALTLQRVARRKSVVKRGYIHFAPFFDLARDFGRRRRRGLWGSLSERERAAITVITELDTSLDFLTNEDWRLVVRFDAQLVAHQQDVASMANRKALYALHGPNLLARHAVVFESIRARNAALQKARKMTDSEFAEIRSRFATNTCSAKFSVYPEWNKLSARDWNDLSRLLPRCVHVREELMARSLVSPSSSSLALAAYGSEEELHAVVQPLIDLLTATDKRVVHIDLVRHMHGMWTRDIRTEYLRLAIQARAATPVGYAACFDAWNVVHLLCGFDRVHRAPIEKTVEGDRVVMQELPRDEPIDTQWASPGSEEVAVSNNANTPLVQEGERIWLRRARKALYPHIPVRWLRLIVQDYICGEPYDRE